MTDDLFLKAQQECKVTLHINSDPEIKNNITIGLIDAAIALKERHDVEIFFAADGVYLLVCAKWAEIVAQGTGHVKSILLP